MMVHLVVGLMPMIGTKVHSAKPYESCKTKVYEDLVMLSGLMQTRLVYNIKIVSFMHSDENLFL